MVSITSSIVTTKFSLFSVNLVEHMLRCGGFSSLFNPVDRMILSFLKMENIRRYCTKWGIEFSRTNGCSSIVDIDFHHEQKKCKSCLFRTFELVNNTYERSHKSVCNITNTGSSNCEGSVHNFGLYCCIVIDHISLYFPPNPSTNIKTWLRQHTN